MSEPRGGRWPNDPMTMCHLEVDSPSYPPDDDERRQCDCANCRQRLGMPAPDRALVEENRKLKKEIQQLRHQAFIDNFREDVGR
jgi:hypothetical protein